MKGLNLRVRGLTEQCSELSTVSPEIMQRFTSTSKDKARSTYQAARQMSWIKRYGRRMPEPVRLQSLLKPLDLKLTFCVALEGSLLALNRPG